MDGIFRIKWETGDMIISIRDFLDVQKGDMSKLKLLSKLIKESDRKYKTNLISDVHVYCSSIINENESWLHKRKTKSYIKWIEEFMHQLSVPLPDSFKSKRLF